MGAANGRPLDDDQEEDGQYAVSRTAASLTQDSGIGLGASGADATDASSSPPAARRLPRPPGDAGGRPRLRTPPTAGHPAAAYCNAAYVSDKCSSGVEPLPVEPPPPFDMSPVAAAMAGPPALARARANHGRMSPSVYNHQAVADCNGRLSPSVYNHKVAAAAAGRASPACDLGYHTLAARCWQERCPRDSPRPHLPEPPLSTSEHLIRSMFKPGGKRNHKPSPLERLSDELTLRILSYLSTSDLCFCARVCRRWYFLVWEPQLWTSITLTGETTSADRALRQIVKLLCRDNPGTVCHTVERVELSGCSRLTDRGVALLARRCPQLRHLDLRGCANISNQALMEVVAHCRQLQHLDVTGCQRVTCLDLSPTMERTRLQLRLQYLDLTDCHLLSDAGLQLILQSCPQLQFLYMRRCHQISDAGVSLVAACCPLLREFSISDCSRVSDLALQHLAALGAQLRYLSVAKCERVTDAGLAQLARSCYKLRYLNVRGCPEVTDAGLAAMARGCQRMRALDIGKCDVTDQGLRTLAQHCPNLKKLSVKSCELISDMGVRMVAYHCRGLQQLSIQDSPVTLEGYRTVKKYCKRCIIEHTNPGFF